MPSSSSTVARAPPSYEPGRMSSQVGTLLASSMPQGTQVASHRPVDGDPVAPVGIAVDPDRIRAIALFDVVVPHGRRFADVPVRVDHAVCHWFPPKSLARL